MSPETRTSVVIFLENNNLADAQGIQNSSYRAGSCTFFTSKQMQLARIILSEVTQIPKDKSQMYALICGP